MLLNNKRIFLLEDDPRNFAVILTLVRKNGGVPIHDYWGDITLNKLSAFAEEIDLILLDLMLPGNVTGYDVYDAIKELPEFNGVPIVAVSAADPDTEIPKTKEKGFSGFISKPINARKFVQQLADIMNGESIWE
jgi:CheY-like chemotaxis protein